LQNLTKEKETLGSQAQMQTQRPSRPSLDHKVPKTPLGKRAGRGLSLSEKTDSSSVEEFYLKFCVRSREGVIQ
jgi:hypothetical protein